MKGVDNKMNCKICGGNCDEVFTQKILNKYDVKYYQCKECAYHVTENPYWIEEAYSSALSVIDTGVMARNLDLVKTMNVMVRVLFKDAKHYLDYGGGYGIFTRMMRDSGYDWVWCDKYAENLVAKGFEYTGKEKIDVITSFELFEHFVNPMEDIGKMLGISDTIVFSTLVYSSGFDLKKPGEWWYYTPSSGQHISFYSVRTLEEIAKRNNLNYYMIYDWLHIITARSISKIQICIFKFYYKLFKEVEFRNRLKKSYAVSDMDYMSTKI